MRKELLKKRKKRLLKCNFYCSHVFIIFFFLSFIVVRNEQSVDCRHFNMAWNINYIQKHLDYYFIFFLLFIPKFYVKTGVTTTRNVKKYENVKNIAFDNEIRIRWAENKFSWTKFGRKNWKNRVPSFIWANAFLIISSIIIL